MIRRQQVRERLRLNADLATAVLGSFIADAVDTSGCGGVVLGLSGGVDSALAAALAVRALGPPGHRLHRLPLGLRGLPAQAGRRDRAVRRVPRGHRPHP